jgi:hypothetical protein
MNTVDYSHIVGVFRDRTQADRAVEELKQAGIGEDQIEVTDYNLLTTEEAESSSRYNANTRVIVHVQAEGKEQGAVGILVQNGANNADIPPGTQLVRGSLESADSETADLIHEQPADVGSTDSFFGKVEGERLA